MTRRPIGPGREAMNLGVHTEDSMNTDSSDDPWRNRPLRPVARVESVVTGVIVILVGLVFLVDNLGLHLPFPPMDNGWALFILLGAVAPAYKAWFRARELGGIDAIVVHRMLTAAATVLVAAMFLLELSFERWWPLFVILGGFYAMVPGRRERGRRGGVDGTR